MSRSETKLKRLQHPGFGKELRHLQCSSHTADRDLAVLVVAEINQLHELREKLKPHRLEDRLNGSELSEISYLREYRNGFSFRIYFLITDGILWVIALDTNKRATNLTKGMVKTLIGRLHDIRKFMSEARNP